MTIKNCFPTIEPSLDLNFAGTKRLDARIAFTRASSGSYVDEYGVLRIARNNEARFDHHPTTGESLGLLVEEQRTNGIRNNTMVGTVAGTPGTLPTNWAASVASGLSREVVGTGITNGINYIDLRIFGTATNTNLAINLSFEGSTIAAASGQSWAESVWVSMVAGSTTGISYIQPSITERSAAFADLAYITGSNFVSTISTFLRRTYVVTLGNASTAYVVPGLWVNPTGIGAVIDITLRIGLPQLEQGAFATSVIPTSGATVTRSADVASITGTNFSSWYRQDEGTVFADINSAPVNNTPQIAFDIAEGVGNERMFVRRTAAAYVGFALVDNGVTQADIGSVNTVAASSRYLAAGAYRLNSVHIGINGQLGTAEDTAATIPTVDRLFIGQNFASGQHVNGSIRRLTYWPQRLPNSTLQSITQ